MLYFIIMAQSRLNLSIENKENLLLIAKALSSEIRINILRMLKNYSMSISELAEALSQPVSSTALNVRILENAALISTEIIYTQRDGRAYAAAPTTIWKFPPSRTTSAETDTRMK